MKRICILNEHRAATVSAVESIGPEYAAACQALPDRLLNELTQAPLPC